MTPPSFIANRWSTLNTSLISYISCYWLCRNNVFYARWKKSGDDVPFQWVFKYWSKLFGCETQVKTQWDTIDISIFNWININNLPAIQAFVAFMSVTPAELKNPAGLPQFYLSVSMRIVNQNLKDSPKHPTWGR